MGKLQDLKGKQFGEWTVLEHLEKSYWLCRCSCGAIKAVHSYRLRNGLSKSCGHNTTGFKDLTGQKFSEWEVLRYVGDRKWECKCSCGKEQTLYGRDLISGHSKSCGHSTTGFKDLTGKKFNEWTVLVYAGNQIWNCVCSCGKESKIHAYKLTHNQSKSCGHATTGFKDLTGKQIGYWNVLEYIGNRQWKCRCKCGTEKVIYGETLNTGRSLSCGCMSTELAKESMMEKYGVTHNSKFYTDRTPEQLEMIESEYNLMSEIMRTFDVKPKVYELASHLGITESMVLKYIHKYNLENLVDIGITHKSKYEEELNRLFPGGIQRSRDILDNLELDIYYPEHKLAIEFNGSYWHSEEYKDKKYHQNKTLMCRERGIQLIHIFEYEWKNDDTKEKLINYIKYKFNTNNRVIPARKCKLRQIDNIESDEFLNSYHLQNSCNSSIQLGLEYGSELVGVMTFGRPRFNGSYEYELLRLAFKSECVIIGGAERLFKYMLREYNPNSIISYCNIAKFTGNVYNKLGFKAEVITEPNYVWVDGNSTKVYKRYDTMVHKLLEAGIAHNGETETTAMKRLGYSRIYDSGNIRFTWHRPN